MEKDKLSDEITSVKKWCKDNNLSIFFGAPDKNNISEVSWDSEEDGDLDRYLAAFKNTEGKILIMNIVKNDIDPEDKGISNYKETLEDEGKEEFNKALITIKKTKGQIVSYGLFFFFNNVSYEFVACSDWDDDYYKVLNAYDFSGQEDDLDDDDDENEAPLDEERISELAQQFVSNQKYIDAKNPIQRGEIIEGLLKQENVTEFRNVYKVKRKADAIYESEIKPKQEAEIKKKVLELKSKNLKKIEIASKLGISSGMVNKFYYTNEN